MRNPTVAAILGLMTLPLVASQCEEDLPQPVITVAAFTQAGTWYLSEYKTAGQITRADSIKDRFALRFAPDSSYRRILLSNSSETAGTWKLTGSHNRRLHLTDPTGDQQDFYVEAINAESLFLYRDRGGPAGSFMFKTVR
ncbi:lipocalin-like domain-containing protein [Hymenobacter lapidiphilus]|uniref:Lipocalin family protein n=1 Tax=Hymenobacter lapidiphilus TaxID=2608003 RepID=A0A7Y7PQG3_9BACT|nr:lipocalin family protein [Hymenobacter lapidiphilus]NVO31972.1 lipocalin family protein [Hymenobacter lapidiphilus]